MGPGDREFLIHPSFGAAVKTALQPSVVSETASRAFTKKPFDWLLDEQFTNLQVGPLFCFKDELHSCCGHWLYSQVPKTFMRG